MIPFAALLNQLTEDGSKTFAAFLNTAKGEDASRVGRWLASASAEQIRAAADALNASSVEQFRTVAGLGKKSLAARLGCAVVIGAVGALAAGAVVARLFA